MEIKPYEVEDEDKIPNLKIKFDRAAVQKILEVGESESIMIPCKLTDGTAFDGTDRIRVIKEEGWAEGTMSNENGWRLVIRILNYNSLYNIIHEQIGRKV